MTIVEIVAGIDQRLADLDAELTQLNGARAALIGDPEPAALVTPRRARVAAPVTPRRARVAVKKTSYDVVPAGKLLALLNDSSGMRTKELSDASNGDPVQVLTLLKEQVDAGQVRRSGSRASTRWHAVTDEDRIAERVAELEASSRRARARRS